MVNYVLETYKLMITYAEIDDGISIFRCDWLR